MQKVIWTGFVTLAGALMLSAPAFAQATDNGSVTVRVDLTAKAKLDLDATDVTFTDADPDLSPVLTANAPLGIRVKARTSAAGSVALTVLAAGDLSAGGATIPIANLQWAGGGSGYVAGTGNASSAQAVGNWTGSGDYAGSQTYTLQNSWAYNSGNYAVVMNYTLSVP